MKEIMVKIVGEQITKDNGKDSMEFVTEAKLYERGDALYLIYEESEFSGIPGCKTRLKFKGNKVQMKRLGEGVVLGGEMQFEKGKRFTGIYETPYGPIEMEVLTNALKNTLTAEGSGELNIDYHISLKGLIESRNTLNVTIM